MDPTSIHDILSKNKSKYQEKRQEVLEKSLLNKKILAEILNKKA